MISEVGESDKLAVAKSVPFLVIYVYNMGVYMLISLVSCDFPLNIRIYGQLFYMMYECSEYISVTEVTRVLCVKKFPPPGNNLYSFNVGQISL